MPRRKGPPYKAITFRLRDPADAELAEMAHRFRTNKTDMIHRLIRQAFKNLNPEGTNETL